MKTKTFDQAELSINRDRRECLALISTNDVDRDREVVMPEGLRMKGINYAGRPILWSHDKSLPAIGSLIWVKPQGNGILAKFRFAKTEKANEIYELVQDESLSAVSIGFEVFNERPISPLEIKDRPDWGNARTVIDDFEILELSVCNVPSNANARIVAKSVEDAPCWQWQAKALEAQPAPMIPTPKYARKIDLDKTIRDVLRRHDASEIIARIQGKA